MHFDNLIFGYPMDLTTKDKLTLKDYLKFLDVKLNEGCDSLQDRIEQLISLNRVIQFAKVIIFVNLKNILLPQQVENVISCAVRNRCPLILLENTFDNRSFTHERKLSLDEDLYAVLK